MTKTTLHALRRRAAAAAALLSSLALFAGVLPAQTAIGGTGYGTAVRTLAATTQSPVATVPTDGGYAEGEVETFEVPNTVTARWLTAITTGSLADGSAPSSAQTTSELENVSILGGLIHADNVTAIASSYAGNSGSGSNAAGSGFVNLVVNGTAILTDLAPNTRIDLPSVGYVVLNEQSRTGDGATTTGITVNMIHVYLLDGGEIIVGSASSQASR